MDYRYTFITKCFKEMLQLLTTNLVSFFFALKFFYFFFFELNIFQTFFKFCNNEIK